MYDRIKYIFANFRSVLPTIYNDALSYYEQLNGFARKLNEVISQTNNFGEALQLFWLTFVTKNELKNNYKLNENGDFSGSILGRACNVIIQQINDTLSMCRTIIDMVNHRESIGTIYDGGYFDETDPPINIIDGGVY